MGWDYDTLKSVIIRDPTDAEVIEFARLIHSGMSVPEAARTVAPLRKRRSSRLEPPMLVDPPEEGT